MTRLAALPALLVLLLTACGGGDPAVGQTTPAGGDAPETLRIVVTMNILGDVVEELVGDAAVVEVVMPPGSDPHSFSPSAQQADSLRGADLLVVNGAGAEEGMLDVIEAAEAEGTPTFRAISAVDTIGFDDEHHDEHAEEDGHSEEEEGQAAGEDPHYWQDPSRMAQVVTALAQRIAGIDTEQAEGWTARGEEVAQRLEALDAEVAGILDAVPEGRRVLVTTHEAFGYFADRYDFEVLGTVIPGGGTLAEPSASALEDLVEAIETGGVPAIFVESASPSALADALAAEVEQEVEVAQLFADSLSEEGAGAATYEELIRSNATTVAEALAP